MIKICIFGASGFVGRALTERLLLNKDVEIKAVIHSSGNAWPVLRFVLPLYPADQADAGALKEVLKGCTHVVNCALGTNELLVSNLKNVIKACKINKIKRLVHISSITVYGEQPHPGSQFEDGPALAKRGSYGWYKYRQDKLIEKANKEGLSSVVLCPPHISGAYGRIFHQVIDGIKSGTFALVDEGQHPCNLVDVNNLCTAIELALAVENSDGKRIFITNGDSYTWKDLAVELAPVAGINFDSIPRITSEQAKSLGEGNLSIRGFLRSVLQLSQVKALANQTILRRNKFIYAIITKIYRIFGLVVKKNKSSAQISINNHIDQPPLNPWLCKQQTRGVLHRIDRANKMLGYKPVVSSGQSIDTFKNYYKTLYGYGTPEWELQKLLDL